MGACLLLVFFVVVEGDGMLGAVEKCALLPSAVVGGGDEGDGSGGTGVFLTFLKQLPMDFWREDKKEGNVVAVDEERRSNRKNNWKLSSINRFT